MTSVHTVESAPPVVRSVVFIDSSVTDLQVLLTAVQQGAYVELLDTLQDGVEQIAAVLRQYSALESIQIVSHGAEGEIRLGSTVLDSSNLRHYQDALKAWGDALSEDGDLLLYGCNVAAGDEGLAFIDALAQTTRADVAASIDTTGSTLRGANWRLERSTGSIEATSALSTEAQEAYAQTLALVNNGSAGTITFNTSSDVTLLNATGLSAGSVVHADNLLGTGLDLYAQSTAGGSVTVTNANGLSALGIPISDDRLTVNGSLLSPVSHVDLRANSGVFDLLSIKLGSGNLVGNLLGTTVFTVYALDANYQPTGVGVSLTSLVVNEYGLLNFASMANFKGIFGVRIVNPLGFEVGIDDIQVANGKAAPSITSAGYNATSGVLTITAAGISAGDSIDPGKLTLSGQGGSYTLTSPVTSAASGTSVVITLNAADKLALNGVLNNNGGTSVGGTAFNLAAALNWDSSRPSGQDLSGNPVTVSNVQLPTIHSASYDATTHVLTVTGSDLVSLPGAANDITVSKLTLRGEGGSSYTLHTTGNIEVSSATSFSVALSGTDIAAVAALLNKNGAASAGGIAYLLSAGDDWNSVIGNTDTAIAGVSVAVSNVTNSAPTITGTGTATIGDNASLSPFANVTVADSNGDNVSLAISFNAANGTLSGAGLSGSAGSYALSAASPAALTAQLKALTFTPTANQAVVGANVSTTFSLTATDSNGLSSPVNTGTVISATSINDASVISGAVAAQAVAAGATVRPFSSIVITDPDAGTSVTLTIGISQNGGTQGIFTPASASAAGFVTNDAGLTYTHGPAAPGAAQAALQSLVFQAAPGQSATTAFSISVNDGSVTVSNTTTTVVSTIPSSTTPLTVAFSADTGISHSDLITHTAAQTLSGTLSGGLASDETVQVSLDNGATWTHAIAAVGSTTWSLPGQTLTGSGTLQVRVANAGGSGTPLSASYVLDTTVPGTTGDAVGFSNDTGSSAIDLVTRIAAQTISGTLSATLAADEHVQVSLDNGGTWVMASSSAGSSAWTLDGQQLLAGSNTLLTRVVDTAGNAGAAVGTTYVLDNTAPTVTLSTSASTLKTGETALITMTFSEAPSGLSLSALSAVGGTVTNLAATANPQVFTVELTPNANQGGTLGSVSLAASSYTDSAGNSGGGATSTPITINTLGPSVQISSDTALLKSGQTAKITFHFSSVPSGFTASDVVVTGGSLGPLVNEGGGIYTAEFTPGANVSAAASITVASGSYTDLSGNLGGSGLTPTLQVDTRAPTLVITSDLSAVKTGDTATITFTFSEAPLGFADGDVQVTNGSLSGLAATANPLVYTAVLTPDANVVSGAISITVDAGSYTDLAGNDGTAAPSPAISIHTLAPTTQTTSVAFSADTGISGSDLVTRTAMQTVSGTLDTALALGETVQVSLDNGMTWANASGAVGSTSWSLGNRTLTGSDNLQVRVNDATGNHGPVFSAAYVLDNTPPTVAMASDLSVLKAGQSATLTFTFSEKPSSFSLSSLDVAGGTVSSLAATVDPLVYTAVFTPATGQSGGTATVQVKANGYIDNAGNGGQASQSLPIAINTELPSLTITSSESVLGIGKTAQITFTFSAAPVGFTALDIAAGNGTLSQFAATSDPLVYTAQFIPTAGLASGTASVVVAAGAYTDAFGNPGGGAALPPTAIDTLAPAVVITSSTAALKSGETAQITFTFSEAPLGFDASSVITSGGNLNGLASTANPLVYTALFTPSAGIQNIHAGFSLVAGAVTDAAGNAITPPATPSLSIDTLAPVARANTVLFSADSGSSGTDLVTNVAAQTISGTLVSAPGVGESVEVSLDNGLSWTTATTAGSAWSLPGQTLAQSDVLQVRVTDAAGNHGPVFASAYVLDTTIPTVSLGTSSTALKSGETALVTFTFSEIPVGFSAASLTVSGGTLSGFTATANPLVYTVLFTPAAGVDGGSGRVDVIGGGYTDKAGNAGAGGLLPAIAVDTQAPGTTGTSLTFSSDSGTSAGDRVTNVAAQDITGTLGTNLVNGETVEVSMDSGTSWVAASASAGSNAWSLAGQTLSAGPGQQVLVRVSDAAGNHGTATSFAYTLDQAEPALQITSNKSVLNSADTPLITFTFSEAPIGFSAASISVSGGTLSGFTATANPLVYTGVFTPVAGQASGVGLVSVSQGAYADLAGNNGQAAAVTPITYATLAPGVAIHSDLATIKAGDIANITFQFSHAPLGFQYGDITVSGGTLDAFSATGDPLIYTAQFTPDTGTAQGTAQISIASGTFTDTQGNDGVGGSLPPVTIDTVAPTLSIDSDAAALNASGTAVITFTFSEAPAEFTLGDISASNGILSHLVQTANPQVYTAVFTPAANVMAGNAQVSVASGAYTDLAGNAGTGNSSPSIGIDTVAPLLASSNLLFLTDTGSSSLDLITSVAAQTITGTLSGGVLASGDVVEVSLTNGTTWQAASSSVGGNSWVLTGQDLAAHHINGNGSVQVRVSDGAGNHGAVTTHAFVLDTTPPTVSISSDLNSLRIGQSAVISFTFSEVPADFTVNDLVSTGGSLSGFAATANPLVYTVVLTPTPGLSGSASVTLDNGKYTDIAGNNGAGSSSPTISVDMQVPTLRISSSATALKAGQTTTLTFAFSEAPVGFSLGDISATNGALSDFAASADPLVYTAIFTPAPGLAAGNAVISVASGRYSDAAGNLGVSADSGPIAIHTVAPTTRGATVVFSDDQGASHSDLVVNSPTQTISGTLDAQLAVGEHVEVSLDGGTTWLSALSSGPMQWTLAPQLLTGSNALQVRVADTAGNTGPVFSASYVLDQVAPTMAVTTSATTLRAGESATLTFTFSETPIGFSMSSLDALNGSLSHFAATADPRVYTVQLMPAAGLAGASAGVSLAQGQYTDIAGNPGAAVAWPLITVDSAPPVLQITSDKPRLGLGEHAIISFSFNEPPIGFGVGDIHVTGGVLSGWGQTADPLVYTAIFTPTPGTPGGTATIAVAGGYTDAAGNPGGAAAITPIPYNTLAPTTSGASVAFSHDTGSSNTDLITHIAQQSISGTLDASLVAGESVQVSLDNGQSWMSTTAAVGHNTWALPLPVLLNGSGLLQVRVTDAAGNHGPVWWANYAIDASPTTVTITSDVAVLRDGESATLTFTFSEPPQGFTTGSLTVTGGSIGTLVVTADPKVYTAVFTPATGHNGAAGVALNAGSYTDVAGNPGEGGSPPSITVDNTPPALNPAASNPPDDATGVNVAATLVLSFGERLGSLDPTKIYLRDMSTQTLVAAQASIDANGNLAIHPTTALQTGTAYYVSWDADALKDVAGNAAAAVHDTSTFNFTTANSTTPTDPTTPTEPTQPTEPTNPTEPTDVVDGVQVVTRPGEGGTTITDIPIVTASRNEDPTTPNPGLADIPIVRGIDGHPIIEVGVPVGMGLQAQGVLLGLTGNAALDELLLRIERAGGNPDQLALGRMFEGSLDPSMPLHIQTLTLSAGAGYNPQVPFVVRGSALPGDGEQAIILDARTLPPGSVIKVDNVPFIAVMGNVRLIGGEGQYFATGDDADQWMVLGTGDDILHGGGGQDTVGSLGGNDQVFGDAGNDVVFGGSGNDILSGGTGNDRLDGGLGWDRALQSGSLADYTLAIDHEFLVLTNRTTGEVDRLKSVEMVKFDTGASLYIADSDAEAALAHIATRWLGRDLTADEGVWAQQNSQLTDLEVAQAVLDSPFGAQLQGRTAQELVSGWQTNPQIVRMEATPERVQGTAGRDEINYGDSWADVNLQRTGTDRWEGTSLIDGDMAEFVGIERLHLKDVSVALDTQGTAGKVAALLAVTLGTEMLQHRGLAGEGLAALDFGLSVQAVGEAAMHLVQTQQGHAFTPQETVQWLWTKATGSAGSADQLQPYVQQLQSGQITTGDLVNAAVQHALANPSAQLVGVLDSGLLYNA